MACKPLPTAMTDAALAVALICSTTIIAIFDPHGSNSMNLLGELNYLLHERFFKDPNTNIYEVPWYTQSIIHPSAIVFCISILVFASTSLVFYRLHARDQYRDRVLAGLAILGVLVPLMDGAKGTKLKDTWQITLPWAYTLGLISSAIGHWVWRLLPQEKPIVIDYDYDWDEKIRAGQKLPY